MKPAHSDQILVHNHLQTFGRKYSQLSGWLKSLAKDSFSALLAKFLALLDNFIRWFKIDDFFTKQAQI